MKKKNKKKNFSRIDAFLEMPKEVVSDEPKFTIIGFNEVLVENYKNILEYEDYFIKINTYIGVVNINGFNLKLEELTQDDIMVRGKIDSIDFENITDEEVK